MESVFHVPPISGCVAVAVFPNHKLAKLHNDVQKTQSHTTSSPSMLFFPGHFLNSTDSEAYRFPSRSMIYASDIRCFGSIPSVPPMVLFLIRYHRTTSC